MDGGAVGHLDDDLRGGGPGVVLLPDGAYHGDVVGGLGGPAGRLVRLVGEHQQLAAVQGEPVVPPALVEDLDKVLVWQ